MEDSLTVRLVANAIVSFCQPERIIMFSRKLSLSGELSSFKLCIVVNTDDKQSLLHRLYVEVDSDVPYDLVLYTPDEWNALLPMENSFAARISRTGVLLHG